jgi:radical S-adenosyl methionine domain-containing protein 2
VVNALNFTDNMSETIALFNPDKWKVLRVLPAISNDLAIAKHEFAEFLARHHRFAPIISAEDNSDMVESYIMINPHGRFFQNSSTGQGYRYSEVIPDVGAQAAFRQISWIADKFQARYAVDRSACPA